jgi:hypothetical protein
LGGSRLWGCVMTTFDCIVPVFDAACISCNQLGQKNDSLFRPTTSSSSFVISKGLLVSTWTKDELFGDMDGFCNKDTTLNFQRPSEKQPPAATSKSTLSIIRQEAST